IAYINGKKAQFIMDDMFRVFMEIDGEMFNDSDYGIFISDTVKDNIVLEKLKELATIALQQDKAKLSDVINIFKTNSVSEIKNEIINSERESEAIKQQQLESQNQALLQQQEMINADMERQRQWESEEKQKDRDARKEE